MIKSILISIGFFLIIISSVILLYSDFLSEKLTNNLNRNLNVDWGNDHPKFTKQNLLVDFLEMSVSWDNFNIKFPKTQSKLILNVLSDVFSFDCVTKINFLLKFKFFVTCNEIKINIEKNKWIQNGDSKISSTFFFEQRLFDDFFDKQGNFKVRIETNNLIVNNINLGHYIVGYSFIDGHNFQILINNEYFILTKMYEGLKIKSPNQEFFILNQNFFENTIKRFNSKT